MFAFSEAVRFVKNSLCPLLLAINHYAQLLGYSLTMEDSVIVLESPDFRLVRDRAPASSAEWVLDGMRDVAMRDRELCEWLEGCATAHIPF